MKTLKELPITNLFVMYSLKTAENRYIHYGVPLSKIMVNELHPDKILEDYFKEDIEIIHYDHRQSNHLETEKLTLSEKSIKKLKNQINHTLFQFNKRTTLGFFYELLPKFLQNKKWEEGNRLYRREVVPVTWFSVVTTKENLSKVLKDFNEIINKNKILAHFHYHQFTAANVYGDEKDRLIVSMGIFFDCRTTEKMDGFFKNKENNRNIYEKYIAQEGEVRVHKELVEEPEITRITI